MAQESAGERSEQATPRRREDARREGRVARSSELNVAVGLLAATAALSFFGPKLAAGLQDLLREGFLRAATPDLSATSVRDTLAHLALQTAAMVLPLSLALAAVGVVSNVGQVGLLFTTTPLTPRWSAINPLEGFKRIFSARGGVELLKAIVKLSIVGLVAWMSVVDDVEKLLTLSGASGPQFLAQVGAATLRLILRVGMALFVVAAIDYAYQRYEWERSLRMTRQEVEQEQKESEGDPRLKARIRILQRSAARRRMIEEVKTADVVITNPIHVAVALKYDRGSMSAPVVVARGLRKMAERMKETAREARVPIVEDPPLARLLFKSAPIGQAIPSTLYRAVAQVLAHVWRLRQGIRGVYHSSSTIWGER